MKRFLFLMALLVLVGCGKKEELLYGPYSIGRDPSWFPLQLGPKEPNLNAFTNALVQAIAHEESVPLHIIDIDWVQLFESLDTQKVSAIFSSLSPTIIAQEKYSFSDPYLLLGPVLIVPFNSTASSLEDLQGKIVATYQYDESVLIVQKYPSIVIQLYQTMPQALSELAEGNVDAVLMPTLDAHSLVPALYPTTLKIASAPLNNKALRLITLKNKYYSVFKAFNHGLEKVRKSSKYTSLRKTYQL